MSAVLGVIVLDFPLLALVMSSVVTVATAVMI